MNQNFKKNNFQNVFSERPVIYAEFKTKPELNKNRIESIRVNKSSKITLAARYQPLRIQYGLTSLQHFSK